MIKNRNSVRAANYCGITNEREPKNDQAAELRRLAVVEMLKGIKEAVLFLYSPSPRDGERAGASARGGAAERAASVLATLKVAKQGLETFPVDTKMERALRSGGRAIQKQEKWLVECERRRREGG